jgi:hypothetical protein
VFPVPTVFPKVSTSAGHRTAAIGYPAAASSTSLMPPPGGPELCHQADI